MRKPWIRLGKTLSRQALSPMRTLSIRCSRLSLARRTAQKSQAGGRVDGPVAIGRIFKQILGESSMIDFELFSRIKNYHEQKGLSASQIAEELDLDPRTVSKWLKENRFRQRARVLRPSKLDPFKAINRPDA